MQSCAAEVHDSADISALPLMLLVLMQRHICTDTYVISHYGSAAVAVDAAISTAEC